MANSVETREFLVWNLSTNSTCVIEVLEVNSDPAIQHHVSFGPAWAGTWASTTDFQGGETRQFEYGRYRTDIRDINKIYQSHVVNTVPIGTGTETVTVVELTLNNTTNLDAGWTLSGNGWVFPNSSIVSILSTTTVEISAAPTGTPVIGENVTFVPPQYELWVDLTIGIEPGYIASQNGYSGQTVLSNSGTECLIMSAPPNSNPVYDTFIRFDRPDYELITLTPGSSSTFQVYFSNYSTTPGLYNSIFTFFAELNGSIEKRVYHAVGINTAVTTDNNPFISLDGGGDGAASGGDASCSAGDAGSSAGDASCSAGDAGSGSGDGGSGDGGGGDGGDGGAE